MPLGKYRPAASNDAFCRRMTRLKPSPMSFIARPLEPFERGGKVATAQRTGETVMHAMIEASPRLKARMAGILYLTGPCGFAEAVRGRLIIDRDPAATAVNILSHEQLFRWALVGDLVGIACYIVVLLLLYDLLHQVNRSAALLAVFFSLMAHTIQAAILVFHYAPLVLLKSGQTLAAFRPDQLQALAYTSLELHDAGYKIDLVFFGCYGLLMGYLIFRSTYFPRILGVLMAFAGLSYLANSTLSFIVPALADQVTPYILLPALGELVLALWLVIKGVDRQRWNTFHARLSDA